MNGPTETPQQAARRLAATAIRDGYKPEALHTYTYPDGGVWYWRIRLKNPHTGEKWIRPMRLNGVGLELGEPAFPNGKPLYRLHDLTARPDHRVFLVEGEWCADALAKAGMLATTSGAADSAPKADWRPLAGRDVTIWPDNHEAGERYATDAAERLLALSCTVRMIDVEKLGLPEKGDAVDWLKANPAATAAEIAALPCVEVRRGEERQEPKPLQRELPPSTPFPIEALGDVLGPAARKMRAIIQAPAAICGNSLLAAADLAVQAHADVVIDGRVFPISEMFVTVGQTGERKSEADKVALRPHREYERALADKYGQDMLAYQRDHDAYEKTKQEALGSKQKSYEAKRRALAELGEAPIRPLEPLLLCEEPTYEGLVKLLAVGQPSVGLFSDEGGRFIGGHGMNSDNLLKTAAGLSGLWDGKPIDRVRVSDGFTKLYGRRVSLHLMVQPEVSQLMLSNHVLIGQGLLSRCLVTWPESTAGTRLYLEADLSTSREIAAYKTLMKGILETTLPLADGARNALAPRRLQPAPHAKRLWVRFHDHVERQLAEGGELASVRGLGNKGPEHAARLAGVLALVEDIHVAHISLDHMKAGIALVTHYLNEALRLYEAGVQDPQLSLAQKLLGWLKARGQAVITVPEIYQLGPRPIRNARMARLLMGILEEYGHVQAIKESSEHRGHPAPRAWSIRL